MIIYGLSILYGTGCHCREHVESINIHSCNNLCRHAYMLHALYPVWLNDVAIVNKLNLSTIDTFSIII